MTKSEHGKHIISAAKSLKRYQLGNVQIAAFLGATSQAGRAGLFAAALKNAGSISLERAEVFAAQEGFYPLHVEGVLLPWLERAGLAHVRRIADGSVESIESLVLTYPSLLEAVSDLYGSLKPKPEDRGCIIALDCGSKLPRPESEIRQVLAAEIGEEKADVALKLVINFRILGSRKGKGLTEPILFSERVWTKFSAKNAQSLSPLTRTDRDVLQHLIGRVRDYQGIPEVLIEEEAKKQNALAILKMGIGVGLLNRTQLKMGDGSTRSFLTTPHFYADMGDEFGEDMTDRVKIFLDSVRNGQHFGSSNTGRIVSPNKLLKKLLDTGTIGPCTAISTDYVTSELAGIVRVRNPSGTARHSYLDLVQADTVRKVHQVITTGTLDSSAQMDPSHVREGVAFSSIEEMRAEPGDVPENLAEVERAIILQLRES